MPHMNELLDIIKECQDYLEGYDSHLRNTINLTYEPLQDFLVKIDAVIKECETLKVGHLART